MWRAKVFLRLERTQTPGRENSKLQGVARTRIRGGGVCPEFGGERREIRAQLYLHFIPEATSCPTQKELRQIADRNRCCSNALRVSPLARRVIFFLFFSFFFFHLTYSRWTSSLPSCLWSQRIFPSLPGSRLTIFLSRCKFSTLTTRQPMVEFYLLTFPRFPLRKKEHKSFFGKNRTHDFRTSRCAANLLDHSGVAAR